MKNIIRILLVCLVCIIALGLLYVGSALTVGAWFIAGDLDFTDEQRKLAQNKAAFLSFSGVVLMLLSIAGMFLSDVVARFILGIFEKTFAKKL